MARGVRLSSLSRVTGGHAQGRKKRHRGGTPSRASLFPQIDLGGEYFLALAFPAVSLGTSRYVRYTPLGAYDPEPPPRAAPEVK